MPLVDANLNCGDTAADSRQKPEEGLEPWPVSGSHTHQFVPDVITVFAKTRGSKLYRMFRPPGLSRIDL